MYHKLGRPKRSIKAELILIQEPGENPSFFRLDSTGSLIQSSTTSKRSMKLKCSDNHKTKKNVLTSDNFIKDDKSSNQSNQILCDTQLFDVSPNTNFINKKNDDLSDINYYLNKKTFPSFKEFELDNYYIFTNTPVLIS